MYFSRYLSEKFSLLSHLSSEKKVVLGKNRPRKAKGLANRLGVRIDADKKINKLSVYEVSKPCSHSTDFQLLNILVLEVNSF